jgi:hypothetical protein
MLIASTGFKQILMVIYAEKRTIWATQRIVLGDMNSFPLLIKWGILVGPTRSMAGTNHFPSSTQVKQYV